MSTPLDPWQALELARRMVADAPAQLASGLTRAVRESSDERLAQVMRTPARRLTLDALFWQLGARVDAARPESISALTRWRITRRDGDEVDVYDLVITDGRCRVSRGTSPEKPRITITVEVVELLRLATGGSDPLRSYLRGDLGLSGDVVLAARLVWLLRGPSNGRVGEA
jgi:alkyl sulfatase BDS1-like metallo-beta-lactamase superfamily hydrolase